ncbi:transposase [Aurantimonas sp. A2-1-M11]
MTKISMLAIDLAKGSFQVCAVGPDGAVLYNRALSRPRLIALLADHPACVVAMETCATSRHWGRVAQAHGHEVRLVPAVYVKPFVERQKNDRADAEAIAEAASRPSMRFVAVKSTETQGRAVAFRTHQCLVRQRTQLINTLRYPASAPARKAMRTSSDRLDASILVITLARWTSTVRGLRPRS